MKLIRHLGMTFELYLKTHTASIRKLNEKSEIIEIPRSINYNSTEYVIKRVRPYAFDESILSRNKHVHSISFAEDSEVSVFEECSFRCSSVKSLSLPASLEFLRNGWCEETKNLTQISISPKNKKFIYFDNKMILGKTSNLNEDYDSIYLVRRDVKDFRIPSFIKYIKSSAFDSCNKIETFIIDEDSELLTIGDFAFASSSIEKFTIPSKLESFGQSWCDDATKLNDITVSPQNKRYMRDEKSKIVYYKSDINNENFDVLFFSPRTIKNVKIPSFVKHINLYAFAYCKNIKSFTFEDNSQLQSIGKFSFYEANVREICIPPSVKVIEENAFHDSKFKKIEFTQNSELEIKDKAFFEIALPSITIPASVEIINDLVFYQSFIKKIEFEKNSMLKKIGKFAFGQCIFNCITIPSSVEIIDSFSFSSEMLDIIEIQEDEKNDKSKFKIIEIADDAFEYTRDNFVLFIPACTEIRFLFKRNLEEEEKEEFEEW